MVKRFFILTLSILFLFLIGCKRENQVQLHNSLLSEEQIERLGELVEQNLVTLAINHTEPTFIEIDSNTDSTLLIDSEYFGKISDIAIDENFIYITDRGKHQLIRYDKNRGDIYTIGQQGRGPADLHEPIQVETNTEYVLVHEKNNNRIQVFNKDFISITNIDVKAPAEGFNLNNQYLVVPEINFFTINGNVVSVYQIDHDFDRFDNLLPVLTNPGRGALGNNVTTIAVADNQQFYIYYYGLPYIFVFDNKLNHKKTLKIIGELIRNFYENIPERLKIHPEPEMVARQLIIGLGVTDHFLFFQISGVLFQVDINEMKIVNRYRFGMNQEDLFPFTRIKTYSNKIYLIDPFDDRIVQAKITDTHIIDEAKLILRSHADTEYNNVNIGDSYE